MAKEQKWRITMHSKKTGYSLFLIFWAIDPMDGLMKMAPLVGPGAEYEMDNFQPFMENDAVVTRPMLG